MYGNNKGYTDMVATYQKYKAANKDMPYPQLIKKTLEDVKNISAVKAFRRYINERRTSSTAFLPFDELSKIQRDLYSEYYNVSNNDVVTNMFYFYFLQNWALYNQIFRFDKVLFDTLTTNTEDISVSVDAFSHFPYPAFFIENEFDDKYNHYIGVFVIVEKDKYVSLCFIRKDLVWFDTDIKLDRGNLSISALTDDYIEVTGDRDKNYMFESRELVKKIAPVLLYLCAENKEVEKIKIQKEKKKKKGKASSPAKTLYTDNRVGYKIGAEIRKAKTRYVYDNSAKGNGKGTKKSPHFRKAHYHSYWTGKRNSDERKLIVKFLPPTYVNNTENNNVVPTIHPVI